MSAAVAALIRSERLVPASLGTGSRVPEHARVATRVSRALGGQAPALADGGRALVVADGPHGATVLLRSDDLVRWAMHAPGWTGYESGTALRSLAVDGVRALLSRTVPDVSTRSDAYAGTVVVRRRRAVTP